MTNQSAQFGHIKRKKEMSTIKSNIKLLLKYRAFYLILLPGIIYFIIFHYVPMYGIIIAFKDFKPMKGIIDSPWVGLKNFTDFFLHPSFAITFKNTLLISFYKILLGFPFPIILALLLNEIRCSSFKRTIQTVTYFPHFMSWVVVAGLVSTVLSPSSGIINQIIKALGIQPIYFMADPRYFRGVLVLSDIWKEMGWGSIIYLASIAGISPELYEAAIVDGANKWQQIKSVTIPCIASTIVMMLILRVGSILNAGFDQIFVMYNANVYDVSDIIDTFVYRMGLESAKYSFATAVGLFKSIIGFIMVLGTNKIAKMIDEENALW